VRLESGTQLGFRSLRAAPVRVLLILGLLPLLRFFVSASNQEVVRKHVQPKTLSIIVAKNNIPGDDDKKV